MRKVIAGLFALVLTTTAALAVSVGQTPGTGPQLIDGVWLNGLAGGQNETYQSGIAAAGSGQSTATQLPAGIALIEIDSGTGGYALPFCYAGTEFSVYNNSGATLTAYPNVANNPLTSAQDTINGSTSLASLANHTLSVFSCAKNGVWAGK